MNAFDYLAVLISIVLGLGITNVLNGFAGIVRQRARVKLYWPLLVWMIILFLIHVQVWWAMFELRQVTQWTFVGFLAVLLQPVTLFLATAVLVPEFSGDGPFDLRELYFREASWFFAGIVAVLLVSLVRTPIVTGHLTNRTDLSAHIVFIGLASGAAFWPNDLVHRLSAVLALLLYTGYIAALFINLE
jgi:hypothetical protein